MKKENLNIGVHVNGEKYTVNDVANLARFRNLFGARIFRIESTKVDDTDTDPNAVRVYGQRSILCKNIEYLMADETTLGEPSILIKYKEDGKEKELVFSLSTEPFKEINLSKALSREFKPEEGWYTDGDAVFQLIKMLNTGNLAKVNARIEKLRNMAICLEEANAAETAAAEDIAMINNIVNG